MTAITDIFPPPASAGGGAPLPTSGYVSGRTSGTTPTINITAPTGKKIVFTHFRPIQWNASANLVDVGSIDSDTNDINQTVNTLEIDGVDVIGNCANMSDFMGKMQKGQAGAGSDAAYKHAFIDIPMLSFSASFTTRTSSYAIAYTYYLADA